MDTKKQLVLQSLNGEAITFELKTLVSQWDSEQVESVYMKYMVYNPSEKKATFQGDDKFSEIATERMTKLVETLVQQWHGIDLALTAENVKKNLAPTEYKKLVTELESIYSGSTLDEVKKNSTPES